MVKKKGLSIMPIVLIAGVGVGGYFIWKYFKKEETEGFVIISTPNFPTKAIVGSTVNVTAIGKNLENESYLCFMKIINQGTGEVISTKQTSNVGAGLTKEFTFEFVMPDIPFLRVEIQAGRMIDNVEKIDSKRPRTIESKEPSPGYPKTITREPYSFVVYNQAQEIQMNDFLGINPPGMDIDTYLEGSTQVQLVYWRDYWVNVWTELHRSDIVEFVRGKYNEYSTGATADIEQFSIEQVG